MQNTLTIARRELRSFFDSLVAYVVVGLSIIATAHTITRATNIPLRKIADKFVIAARFNCFSA